MCVYMHVCMHVRMYVDLSIYPTIYVCYLADGVVGMGGAGIRLGESSRVQMRISPLQGLGPIGSSIHTYTLTILQHKSTRQHALQK